MPNLDEWSEFIEARILQEKAVQDAEKTDQKASQGANQRALEILDKLSAKYPDNQHILKAKAWSLSVLDREEDAASSLIESLYVNMRHRLSGDNDVAKNWINELEALKTTIDDVKATKICTSYVAW